MKFYKQLLLGASLVTIVFLLAAAVRENFLSEWRGWQKAYGKALLERAQTPAEREEALTFEIKLRQEVLPQLKIVDRCVTCHVGIEDPRMAGRPNPLGFHPGDYLKFHPVERFGCTVCHRGQGRAVVFAEAKAEGYYWDYPLLPKRFSEAACTVCHDPLALVGRGGDKRALGEKISLREGCQGCHKLEGRGGAVGPALDNIGGMMTTQLPMAHLRGSKNLANWLEEHFDDPPRVVPSSKMPRPDINSQEREALTLYMLSLEDRVFPPSYIPQDRYAYLYRRTQLSKTKSNAAALFINFCSACHGKEGRGRELAKMEIDVPGVSGADFLAVASNGYLYETLAHGRRGRVMPGWLEEGGLRPEEVTALVKYLRDFQKKPLSYAAVMAATADAALGAEVYQQRCALCHQPQDKPALAPNLFRPNLRKYAGAPFLYQTMMRGRPDTAMGSYLNLTPAEIKSVITFLLTAPQQGTAASVAAGSTVKGDTQKGKTLYQQSCASCHGARGEGGRGPALADSIFQATASDQFLLAEAQTCAERQKLGAAVAVDLAAAIRALGREAPSRLKGVIKGDAAQGAVLYADQCSACHGEKGEGSTEPSLANPDFLNSATDGFIVATIIRGRSGTKMQAFGIKSADFKPLTSSEVRNLVAYLRSLEKAKSTVEVKP